VRALFREFSSPSNEGIEFTLKCSILEIYMEKIKDLLAHTNSSEINSPKAVATDNLKIRDSKENGVYVEGATEIYVNSGDELMALILDAHNHRSVASTRMNAESSRSHCVLLFHVHQYENKNGSRRLLRKSKILLIDLAGLNFSNI